MEIHRISASAVPAPQPVEKEVEVETIQSIYDACVDPEFDPSTADFGNFGKLTSWVALQLSLAGLEEGKDGHRNLAIKLGVASLEVARIVGDWQQFYGNLLDCAEVYFRFREYDDVIEILNTVIDSPSTGAGHARPGAHISLSSVYRLRSEADPDPRWVSDALYHLERGLRYIHSSITDEQRLVLMAGFIKLYGRAGDIPGLVHCARHVGKPEVVDMVFDLVSRNISLDRVISLVARLRALDEHDLADRVFGIWQKQRSSEVKQDRKGDR